MRLLFDTQSFLWWMDSDSTRLPHSAFAAILDTRNTIFVSVINAWEMAIKASLGKLKSPHDVEEAIRHYGFFLLPVLLPHAMAIRNLPTYHRDPFDRMLIAQAQVEGLTLITNDRDIHKYDVYILPG